MGCYNVTCGISNLPIHYGEEAVIFLMNENTDGDERGFCYTDSYYTPCYMPFYGKYNDYGAFEDCYGAGLPVLIQALKGKMHELPNWGENKCHDIPALRKDLSAAKIFELDHEGRFFLDWIKTPRVAHMAIKRSIFDYILENWEEQEYVPSTTDDIWDISYKTVKFADFVTTERGESNRFSPILSLEEVVMNELNIKGLPEIKDYNREELLTELRKGAYIGRFMDAVRKPWLKQIGLGSQNTDAEPYHLLINAMTTTLAKEKLDFEQGN